MLALVGTCDEGKEDYRGCDQNRDPDVHLFGSNERLLSQVVVDGLMEEAFEVIDGRGLDGLNLGDAINISVIALVSVRVFG